MNDIRSDTNGDLYRCVPLKGGDLVVFEPTGNVFRVIKCWWVSGMVEMFCKAHHLETGVACNHPRRYFGNPISELEALARVAEKGNSDV